MNIFDRIASWFARPAPTPAKASFADNIASIARQQAALGIRETSQNNGPGIAKFWQATNYGMSGYYNREPYCAAFGCYVLREAALRTFGATLPPLPRSAAVRDWPVFARRNPGHWRVIGDNEPVRPGDIVCFDFNGTDKPGGTHLAIAVGHQNGDTFATAEANTNAAGSREGDGVYAKTRRRDSILAIIRAI